MKSIILALAIVLLCWHSATAGERIDRPHWSLELKGGAFSPDVSGWSSFYGSNYMGEYGVALAYKILRPLEVGVAASYARTTGKGQLAEHAGEQAGEVTFQHLPLDLFVLGRAVLNEDQWLVPYAGGGYTRMFYKADVKGEGDRKGSVNGYHARAGIEFLLDKLEREAAENLYQDFGLHHTYFFAEAKYTRAMADVVGGGSVNIGGTSYLGGFLFEF